VSSGAVVVRYWAGARRAAGRAEESFPADQVGTVGGLRELLCARADVAKVAGAASFLVDGAQASEETPLRGGEVVDVLPPFAGGDHRYSAGGDHRYSAGG
jgi:molybdopterin synthase sulfur carrier subunit